MSVGKTFEDLGVGDGLLYLIAQAIKVGSVGRCRLIKYYFVAQPVSGDPLLPGSRSGTVRLRRIDQLDPLVAAFPRPPEVLAERFRQGAVCFAATVHEEFAGFIWLVHDRYQEDEVRCRFVPEPTNEAVWDFDAFVEPRFRMGRIFGRLWEAAYEYLRPLGVRWTISRISAFNAPSLRSHERLGARRIGAALFFVAGPMQLTLTSGNPRWHVALSRSRQPDIHLRAPAYDGPRL